jgi:hypothetical protein
MKIIWCVSKSLGAAARLPPGSKVEVQILWRRIQSAYPLQWNPRQSLQINSTRSIRWSQQWLQYYWLLQVNLLLYKPLSWRSEKIEASIRILAWFWLSLSWHGQRTRFMSQCSSLLVGLFRNVMIEFQGTLVRWNFLNHKILYSSTTLKNMQKWDGVDIRWSSRLRRKMRGSAFDPTMIRWKSAKTWLILVNALLYFDEVISTILKLKRNYPA